MDGWLVHRWSRLCMPALMLAGVSCLGGDLWHQLTLDLHNAGENPNGSAVRSESPLGQLERKAGSTMNGLLSI